MLSELDCDNLIIINAFTTALSEHVLFLFQDPSEVTSDEITHFTPKVRVLLSSMRVTTNTNKFCTISLSQTTPRALQLHTNLSPNP